jgi:hypothetical protein
MYSWMPDDRLNDFLFLRSRLRKLERVLVAQQETSLNIVAAFNYDWFIYFLKSAQLYWLFASAIRFKTVCAHVSEMRPSTDLLFILQSYMSMDSKGGMVLTGEKRCK